MKLLIANRGEIAVRIIRACRELGIGTVAVYSEIDRLAPHVMMADEAHPIGPAPAAESYLNVDRLIAAAKKSGAQLVHPGYGFLAENPEFAERVQQEGLTWVGPPPEAIRLMGSKTASRRLAEKAGAPLIPGMMEPVAELAELERFVDQHGLPVLLKAVAGGGGKGMRRVDARTELGPALERARSEGQAYFGDGRVYAERLVDRPRHVEVQVVADLYGAAVAVGERECSLQRRHQKVVEECPSPAVTPEIRERLFTAALAVVEAAGYHSVGTVEFLLGPDGSVYFLEMNTRLQVEHPVTEAVYGVDLAQEQIRIALGEPLSWTQEQLSARGHAIECRIYAEDPFHNFAPSPGRITYMRRPSGPGVRVDSGVLAGSTVPLDYDPMLAKLVIWGENRGVAVARLRRALSEYCVGGIATTLSLFRPLVRLPEFAAAAFHTGFLDELLASQRVEEMQSSGESAAAEVAAIAAACLATLAAGRLPRDPFAHSGDGGWWEEGLRVLHGRFPR
ncbi:MAG: ATP-grasp domain-containing protein [Acidobacteria bacterium]|nr:ATP-grasp domain-containing protein [Acidobacteriota bacterium]